MARKVFVCYARSDEDFALSLTHALGKDVDVWIDQKDIPAGADWDDCIDEALRECAQFLIVLSPRAVASREVRGELRVALDERKVIIPVLRQDCEIPRRLRLLNYVDFRNRRADDPQTVVALARELKKAGAAEPEAEAFRLLPNELQIDPAITAPMDRASEKASIAEEAARTGKSKGRIRRERNKT